MVIAEAEALLRGIRTFEQNARLYGQGDAGEIEIGFGPLIASTLMPIIGATMLREKPGITITASIRPPGELVDQLFNDEIEIFFHSISQLYFPSELDNIEVGRLKLDLMVRSGHPVLSRDIRYPKDLTDFPLACGGVLVEMFTMNASIKCDNYEILREITLNSDAIWLSSPFMCDKEIKNGDIVQLRLPFALDMFSDIAAFTLKNRAISPLSRRIIDISKQYFASISRDVISRRDR
jgi:DNA-binding transcriptional LysR family regulator